MTRSCGWYSYRERRKLELQALPEVQLELNRHPSPTWAQCIKRAYEINPPEAYKQRHYVEDPDEALEAKSDYAAPPAIHRTSNFEEHLCVDDIPDYDSVNAMRAYATQCSKIARQ